MSKSMGFNGFLLERISFLNPNLSAINPTFQCLASDKTHYKPFELPIPEQWVFGYPL